MQNAVRGALAKVNEAMLKWPWLWSAVYCAAVFVPLFSGGFPRYDTNDDYAIARTAISEYGASSWIPFTSPLLIRFEHWLYTLIPRGNIHALLILGLLLLCFWVMTSLLIRRTGSPSLVLAVMLPAQIIFYTLVQFTMIAYVLLITGALCAFCACTRERLQPLGWLAGLLFAALGILYRTNAGVTVMAGGLILTGAFVLFLPGPTGRPDEPSPGAFKRLLKNLASPPARRMLAGMLVFVLMLPILMQGLPHIAQDSSPEAVSYRTFNKVRAQIIDSPRLSYEQHQDTYEQIGWTSLDADMFYRWSFQDSNTYSLENLQVLSRLAQQHRWTTDYESLERLVGKNLDSQRLVLLMLLFYITAIFLCFAQKRIRWPVILTAIGIFLLHAFFLVYGRNPLRVVAPQYLMGLVILLAQLNPKTLFQRPAAGALKKAITIGLFSLCIAYFSFGAWESCQAKSSGGAVSARKETLSDFHAYVLEHPDTLFIGDSPYGNYLQRLRERPYPLAYNHLFGGWTIYSNHYVDGLQRFGVHNPVEDMLTRDDIVYICINTNPHLLRRQLRSKYAPDVDMKLVERFGNIRIYRYDLVP